MMGRRLLLSLLVVFLNLVAVAGTPPGYRYGDAWWEEYAPDDATALLLHFGKPQTPVLATLRAEWAAKASELDKLATLDESPEESGDAPIDDDNRPPGIALDYSRVRKSVTLGPGAAIVPQGQFGAGLRVDGTAAIRLENINGVGPVECWFKVDVLPKAPACVFSVANDEARLLLLPDGRLELHLRLPHGIPAKTLTPEALAAINARDAAIITATPIALNTWHHVAVFNMPHVVSGAGPPFDATIRLNGVNVANYLSENNNDYQFLGRGKTSLMLGNSFTRDQGFIGWIDEVRISTSDRDYYDRPPMPWRDATATRPLHFNTPYFRRDSTRFHISLDQGERYDRGGAAAQYLLKIGSLAQLTVDGIRGMGWLIDPTLGMPQFPLPGLLPTQGALECWVRPVNWDDTTGYWHHSPPPQKELTVLRLYGKDAGDGKVKVFISAALPRAYNLERVRVPIDPGHWNHLVVNWEIKEGKAGAYLFVNGKYLGRATIADAAVLPRMTPQYAEFGVTDSIRVKHGEPPVIAIDEVVGYAYPLAVDEIEQARRRWMGALEPIKLYADDLSFKWSLQRLEYTLKPLLPDGMVAATCNMALLCDGKVVADRKGLTPTDTGSFVGRLNDGATLPYGTYRLQFSFADAQGKPLLNEGRDWTYAEEPWRQYRGGILETVPAPWTPLVVTKTTLTTRMTTYTLGADGLPTAIAADGQNLLAGPVQLLEGGTPLAGAAGAITAKATEADWDATFTGKSCDVRVYSHAEYDGMIRYTLTVKPKGKVDRLAFVIPLKAAYAKRYLYYPMGDRGVRAGSLPAGEGPVIESRYDPAPNEYWRDYQKAREKQQTLTWEAFWGPKKPTVTRYNFYGHLDLNDMNRGLWWFCDNAAGWAQSKETSAIQIVRRGDRVSLVLNLVAEPTDYHSDKPIVFAILPHPARPLPEKYRLFNRVDPKVDNRACDIFDAFRPWPMDPRGEGNAMRLYPTVDPKNPDAGPSWSYAERCLPSMTSNKPTGLRTLYLSRAWFSCRAGAYDNWEWRSGDMGAVSLTPSFVNYLCWEMNEWIKRGIWDAIYLDECYEYPTKNVEAGQAVLLPDGSVQPGVTNFQFRELMKRWRNLFTANGKEPVLIGHHTYSFQYHGLLYCDAMLDGENKPIVSLTSRDWIDSTSKEFFEVVQNGRLWGVTPFYMPFIAEGGFNNKTISQYPRWQWRMARQAQSQFAQYEVATVYENQGSQVHNGYWADLLRWGAGTLAVTFHPYWDNARYVKVDGQGDDTLVSLYTGAGKALLIVSNRRAEEREVRVTLDLAALGLPAEMTVRSQDSTYAPPEGKDFQPAPGGNAAPDDPDAEEIPEVLNPALPSTVTVKGNVLTIPVRARDYRVIALE